jgi:hypothetical protein
LSEVTDPTYHASDFRQQRTVGIAGIAVASLLAAVLWFGIDLLMSPLPGMALSMIVLLYVTSRFGSEIAGTVGAIVPLAAFFAIEAVLFWGTRPVKAK